MATPPNKRRFAMYADDHKTVLSAEQARGGKELGVMRYVLHISLGLAVVAGVVLYFIFF
jgi:hypothetical protein